MPSAPARISVSHPFNLPVLQKFKISFGIWHLLSFILAGVVLMPLLVLGLAWFSIHSETWEHLFNTILGELLRNTFVLLVSVGIGVTILGVSLAWLTTLCEFPGRRYVEWALMLPLAMPAYVLAFVIIGIFDYTGVVQTTLRGWFGSSAWFPPVRSEAGIVTVMVLALYPYVYMLARLAFLRQGQRMIEAAQMLGYCPYRAFWAVSLPVARPAIAAGVSLALMETLADFGVVSVFNYDTFTTAIYKSWYGFSDLMTAAQLSTLLLLFVLVALGLERRWRGQARYHSDNSRYHRYHLKGYKAFFACFYTFFILTIAFFIPLLQLIYWVWVTAATGLDSRYIEFLMNTLLLGGIAALLTILFALILAISQRLEKSRSIALAAHVATLGYALPGTVLAVGIMLSVVWLDKSLQATLAWWNISIGLLLTGGLMGLFLAYIVRFLAVAYNPIESSLQTIRPSLQEAARSLGTRQWEMIYRLYLPLLRSGLLTGFLLVLVDVMKEMPATLLLRPFNWDTLAVRIYGLTSEGRWEEAALPALTLVFIGLLPVALLVKQAGRRE